MQRDKQPRLMVYSHGELLGDALLKLPAISTLKKAFPAHRIIWLPGRGPSLYAGALSPLVEDYIDEVYTDVRLGHSWSEIWRRPLRNEYFDIIIDSQTILRSSLALKRVPHRLFISPAASFLFSDKKPKSIADMKSGSVRTRLLELIRLACGKQVEIDFKLNLPDIYRHKAKELLPEDGVYVGLAPGSGVKRKCWPLDNYIQVAKDQLSKSRRPVFFLGPNEADWQKAIKDQIPEALFPEQENYSLEVKGPLLSIALAERIQVGVANDSGAGHIMAIAGQPLISLFGHSNVEKFVQEDDHRRVIQAIDYGGVEMQYIPIAAVIKAVDEVIQ